MTFPVLFSTIIATAVMCKNSRILNEKLQSQSESYFPRSVIQRKKHTRICHTYIKNDLFLSSVSPSEICHIIDQTASLEILHCTRFYPLVQNPSVAEIFISPSGIHYSVSLNHESSVCWATS